MASQKKTASRPASAKKSSNRVKPTNGATSRRGERVAFPKHSSPKAIRIASAILDQNAGKPCTRDEAARMLGLASAAGPFGVEIASGVKFGLLEQPQAGHIQPSAIARKILRPQSSGDPVD